ncbi:hypothetical protein RFI_09286 [Reticulomyxa filosa]|uniref:Kelch motif family protein n=1 Tax=Reticulomyxa filosa TaxID=46433 RepID=X6NQ58_RETFI|nr:hypothetical protein RFI_09286 [Reticulomyxa filosa]|eukprot:ETO27844.1 hypothetical protein RFI_09286 [Reticulomyxa filosa]
MNINNMSNRNTIIKPTPFQTLKNLPKPFSQTQCVQHKHEILVCGGVSERDCYSYHTLKNEYKFICEYPSDVTLVGHCVLKWVDKSSKDSNEITLLSFGGNAYTKRHTLVMKYVSVWDDNNEMNKLKKTNNCNEWVPFTDNDNNPIQIGRNLDDYQGMRAVIGGSNNHLLFITFYLNNISVFDLNTFQFIKHDTLPTNDPMYYHCFVSKSENEQEAMKQIIKKNKIKKKKNEMLLFKHRTGLLIKYDEIDNTFQFHKLPVCKGIAPSNEYAYVCINDVILFFGPNALKKSYKYAIQNKKWIKFKYTLPIPLYDCFGISNEHDTYIHIIGGSNRKDKPTNEIQLVIQYWIRISKIKLGWIHDFNKIIIASV